MHDYLVNEVGIEKWAHVMFKGYMYNIMTTNIIKTLNSTLKKAREYPLLLLLNAILEKMLD